MSGEMAAAGEAVTGALAARATEPRAGEAVRGSARGLCLNCGTRLLGEHCHRCGQAAHVHRTVGAIGHELAHGVVHFEGKIWRTLPLLVFRPGELTRRYIAGERARFVSPLALFLFTVFLMFAVTANLPVFDFEKMNSANLRGQVTGLRAEVADELASARASIARDQRDLAEERRKRTPDVARIAGLERRIAAARENEAGLTNAQRLLPAPDPGADASPTAANSWLEAKYLQARDNPKLLLYKVKTSAYKYSWALIPISLPFIWLLFPLRRDVGMYDHAVFATYSLSFMSLLVIALSVLAAMGVSSRLLFVSAMLIPPFHLYKQLKGAYRLRRTGALWRTGWLLTSTLFTLTLFTLLLLYLGTAD